MQDKIGIDNKNKWGDEACRTILCQDHNEQNYSNLVPTFVCVGPKNKTLYTTKHFFVYSNVLYLAESNFASSIGEWEIATGSGT